MTSSQRASTNEATKAVSLALLLDGRACGLTSSQIRESGALGSSQDSAAAFLKQFARARERLARVGIIIRNVAPTGEEARYVVDPGLSYAATNSIELTGEEAFQLTYLMTLCLQTNVPFKDDLRRARDELLSMMRPSATFPEPDMTEAPDKNSCQTRTSSDKPCLDDACASREDESVLDIARDAYIRRRPLSFSYINARGMRSERVVKVYGFFFYHARAYLVGLDGAHDEVRVFRTSRVEARPQPRVLVEEGSYVIPDDFDIHEHMGLPFHYGDDDFVAEFRDMRGLFERERESLTKGHGSWHEDHSDGQARWNVRVRNMEVMAEWATKAALDYGLMPQAPQELRDTIVKGLHKVADLHA